MSSDSPRTEPEQPCPICRERDDRRHRLVLSIVANERLNPARYTYGPIVDRARVDAHLRAEGVIK
jgi:hypothetical protein